jgi:hypothetical protein
MVQLQPIPPRWYVSTTRVIAFGLSLTLLVPFVALALMPMLLFALPVAIVGLPFLIPAFVTGTLSARDASKRRAGRPHFSLVRAR